MGNKSGKRNSRVRCKRGGGGGRVSVRPGRESQNDEKKQRRLAAISLKHGISARVAGPPIISDVTSPSRNDPCPCGSGAKWKRCCADKES